MLIGPSPSGSDFLSLKHEPMGFKVRTTVELVKVGPTMDCEGGLKVKMEGAEEATIGLGFVMNQPVVVTSVGGDTSYHYCLEDKQSVVAVKKSAVDEKKAGGVGLGVGLTFTAISNERVNGEVKINSLTHMTDQGTIMPPPPPPPVSKASVDRVKCVASVDFEMEWTHNCELILSYKNVESGDLRMIRKCPLFQSGIKTKKEVKGKTNTKNDGGMALTQQGPTTFKVKRSDAGTFVMSHANNRAKDLESKSQEVEDEEADKSMRVGVYAVKKGGEGDNIEVVFKDFESC
ncbi:hypothetical protein TL16_g09120 [Triparma laevis f. inornata]|uniref:Uncharacterized protein n=1 Tax=Triparma laevis f. inornata TaxID=1714386 RepID=A0A9W7B8Y5_9STRA|nr:hypothetical protein TL16_g09120 [Triparma laevis f. inornata]